MHGHQEIECCRTTHMARMYNYKRGDASDDCDKNSDNDHQGQQQAATTATTIPDLNPAVLKAMFESDYGAPGLRCGNKGSIGTLLLGKDYYKLPEEGTFADAIYNRKCLFHVMHGGANPIVERPDWQKVVDCPESKEIYKFSTLAGCWHVE